MFNLATLFGVPVRIHWTFNALVLWLLLGAGPWFTFVVVASLLAHEFGHVFAARRRGYDAEHVTAFWYGMAVKFDEKLPANAMISFAGPYVNICIALASFSLTLLASYYGLDVLVEPIAAIVVVNISLFMFNMFPLFPLDGAHIARGMLMNMGVDFVSSTKIVCYTGIVLASIAIAVAVNTLAVLLTFCLTCCILISLTELKHVITSNS